MLETDDFAIFLAEEARSADAAIHQFMENSYRFSDIHVFVEGDDDGAYYLEQIRAQLGLTAHHYICGGKAEVIRAWNELKGNLSFERVLFTVDRDHQDVLGEHGAPPPIYTTDFYSFESEYVDVNFVSAFLTTKLNLPQSNSLHSSVLAGFGSSDLSFCRAIRPLMGLILAIRENSGRLNLNNLSMEKLFKVDGSGNFGRNRSFTRDAIKSIVIDNGGTTLADALRWTRKISPSARLNWIRGKYYLWSVFAFLRYVSQAICAARKKVGKKKGKMPPSVGNYEAFKDMIRPIKCPGSLTFAFESLF